MFFPRTSAETVRHLLLRGVAIPLRRPMAATGVRTAATGFRALSGPGDGATGAKNTEGWPQALLNM